MKQTPIHANFTTSTATSTNNLERIKTKTKIKTVSKKSSSNKLNAKNASKSNKQETKFTKSELLQVLQSRELTDPKYKKLKVDELRQLLLPLSPDELNKLDQLKESAKKFKKLKKADLQKALLAAGLGKKSTLSKSQMIDLIDGKGLSLYKPQTLDSSQQDLVDHPIQEQLLVSAGPGSGKTRTMGNFACQLSSSNLRRLIIMFNRAAEDSVNQRVELDGGKCRKSQQDFDPWNPGQGIYCMTFNKLAYRILYRAGIIQSPEQMDLVDQVPAATLVLQKNPMLNWDIIFIDEAQDIQAQYEDFTKVIIQHAPQRILLGDPRQEVITGAQYFSKLWSQALENEKHILRYNHRSHPSIIKALNVYSKHWFKTLHYDQLVPDYKLNSKQSTDVNPNITDNNDIKDDDDDSKEVVKKKSHKRKLDDKQQLLSFFKKGKTVDESKEESKLEVENNNDINNHFSGVNVDTKLNNISTDCPSIGGITDLTNNVANQDGKGVKVNIRKNEEIPYHVTKELMKHQPGDVYIICPVTVKKFKFEQVFLDIKNCLVDAGCLTPLVVLSDEGTAYRPTDEAYYVGSSKKLKGTEKKTVILLGLGIYYDDFGIGSSEMIKMIFVALSRAIENMIIFLPDSFKLRPESALYPILMRRDICGIDINCSIEDRPIKRLTPLETLTVKDDLSPVPCLNIKGLTTPFIQEDPDKQIKILKERLLVKHSEDFIGLYIEALLALKLGANVTEWTTIITRPETNIKWLTAKETREAYTIGNFLIHLPDKTYQLCICHTESKETTEQQVQELKSLMNQDLAYVLCVLNYTSQIGKWWIASRPVLEAAKLVKEELNTLIESIPRHLNLDMVNEYKVIWSQRLETEIFCQRSKKQAARIVGMADLILMSNKSRNNHMILEIKYGQHKEAHFRQTSCYSAMTESAKAILINLLEGTTHLVKPLQLSQAAQWTRITLAIRNGRASKMGKRLSMDGFSGAILTALDVETDNLPITRSNLYEVGGAAWYFGTDSAESVFSQQSPACQKDDQSFTGLSFKAGVTQAIIKAGHKQLQEQSKDWFSRCLTGRKIGLAWGVCDDFEAAGINECQDFKTWYNLESLYKQFLVLNKCERRSNNKLCDAVEHLFPGYPIHYHRAFDDVVATVLVANAIFDFGSVL